MGQWCSVSSLVDGAGLRLVCDDPRYDRARREPASQHGGVWRRSSAPGFGDSPAITAACAVSRSASEAGGRAFESHPGHHRFLNCNEWRAKDVRVSANGARFSQGRRSRPRESAGALAPTTRTRHGLSERHLAASAGALFSLGPRSGPRELRPGHHHSAHLRRRLRRVRFGVGGFVR